jgi:proline iminopeptidase
MKWLAWIVLLLLLQGCATTALKPGEGFLQVPGGPVWYRVFGTGDAVPLLMVHGGPGIRSCYFERLAILLSRTRPVILYDQLGSGRSGRPMDPSLWQVERFVRELAEVRRDLSLRKVHLLGHSWGTALVAEHAARKDADGIQSVSFVSPYFSSRQWAEDADQLRAQLPPQVLETLVRHERTGDTDSKEYQEAQAVFNDRHLFHVKPAPVASCAQAPRNDEIYRMMWGPTDFRSTGILRDYDATGLLPKLPMPVLYVTGRYDVARPETAARFQAMTPGSELAIVEDAGHVAPLEAPERMAEILEVFLEKVEHRQAH